MSSALVRQALEFVDQEESGGTRGERRAAAARRRAVGQDNFRPYNRKNKKSTQRESKSVQQIAEENIKKLLALSKSYTDEAITEKIVQRAIKGKPLLDKVEAKVDEGKSILFPDEPPETFKNFEKEYFCS